MAENEYLTGTGQWLTGVHPRASCVSEHCVIHNPSDHCMRQFPTHWRADRKLMERICPHGIGHPDPDDIAFKRAARGDKFADTEEVHGCDGCCSESPAQASIRHTRERFGGALAGLAKK
jgi:hypothetical protein